MSPPVPGGLGRALRARASQLDAAPPALHGRVVRDRSQVCAIAAIAGPWWRSAGLLPCQARRVLLQAIRRIAAEVGGQIGNLCNAHGVDFVGGVAGAMVVAVGAGEEEQDGMPLP